MHRLKTHIHSPLHSRFIISPSITHFAVKDIDTFQGFSQQHLHTMDYNMLQSFLVSCHFFLSSFVYFVRQLDSCCSLVDGLCITTVHLITFVTMIAHLKMLLHVTSCGQKSRKTNISLFFWTLNTIGKRNKTKYKTLNK